MLIMKKELCLSYLFIYDQKEYITRVNYFCKILIRLSLIDIFNANGIFF